LPGGSVAPPALPDPRDADLTPKVKAKDRRAIEQEESRKKKHGDADYEEPASDKYAKWKAEELQKRQGKDARRSAHDKKRDGLDRSKKQLDDDYE